MDQPLAALEVYRTGLDVFQGNIFNLNKYAVHFFYEQRYSGSQCIFFKQICKNLWIIQNVNLY